MEVLAFDHNRTFLHRKGSLSHFHATVICYELNLCYTDKSQQNMLRSEYIKDRDFLHSCCLQEKAVGIS